MSPKKTTTVKAAKSTTRRRRSPIGREDVFAVVVALMYHRGKSLEQLSCLLDLSASTIKRVLQQLREAGVISGRLGSLRINLVRLAKPPLSCSSVLVAINVDVKGLSSNDGGTLADRRDDEHNLLTRVCNDLPLTPPYKGQIIVEQGHIVMGHADIGMVIIAHALSSDTLFDFVRLGIEKQKGIRGTQTLMLHRSVGPMREMNHGLNQGGR